MGKVIRAFWTSTFVPKGLSGPALELYTCIKTLNYIPGPGIRWAFTGPLVLWFLKIVIACRVRYFWKMVVAHSLWTFLKNLRLFDWNGMAGLKLAFLTRNSLPTKSETHPDHTTCEKATCIPVNVLKIQWGESTTWSFSTYKAAHASKVMTISMGEIFGNFLWFKGKIWKIQ